MFLHSRVTNLLLYKMPRNVICFFYFVQPFYILSDIVGNVLHAGFTSSDYYVCSCSHYLFIAPLTFFLDGSVKSHWPCGGCETLILFADLDAFNSVEDADWLDQVLLCYILLGQVHPAETLLKFLFIFHTIPGIYIPWRSDSDTFKTCSIHCLQNFD